MAIDLQALAEAIRQGDLGPGVSADPTAVAATAGRWSLWRHGGRRGDSWRLVLVTDNQEEAERQYERTEFRQGGVVLLDVQLRPVRRQWAPRLRTRW